MTGEQVDLAIVGAGAAGLCASIVAASHSARLRVVLVESRPRPGAKILVSGGGRCNIGNARVRPEDFHTASRGFVAKVLRQHPPEAVQAFFAQLGLPLVEEGQGRLYPASQQASEVLRALMEGSVRAGAVHLYNWKVDELARTGTVWQLGSGGRQLQARRVLLATGGLSLPKSGSDGKLFPLLEALGQPISRPFTPGLSPLRLPTAHPLLALGGIATPVRLTAAGKEEVGDLLLTHFGLSGPAVLNVSRHWLQARARGSQATFLVDWLPGLDVRRLDRQLSAPAGARRVQSLLGDWLPQRLAALQLERVGFPQELALAQLDRQRRQALVQLLKADELPVEGERSWHHAECTAGGLDLAAVHADRLELKGLAGLHAAGEMLDVDGRLGGFNFHWAWASATVAARAAVRALESGSAAATQEGADTHGG